MSRVFAVARREYLERVRSKAFLVSTILGPTLLAGFMIARGVMRQKIPEQLELVAALPRNATGKVKKHELRARFARSRT